MAEHFDVVVVGRSPGALICAALLARHKLRTRWMLPAGPLPAPWPAPLFGLKGSPVVKRTLETLGLGHAVRTRVEGEPRSLHVALPDRRFTLEVDLQARGRELGRIFPEHRAALVALFDRIEGYGASLDAVLGGDVPIPPVGFAERRHVRKLLADLPAGQLEQPQAPIPPPLQGLLAALYAVAGRPEGPSEGLTGGGARAVYLLCQGLVPLRGGPEALRVLLEEKLATSGGLVEARRRAASFERQGKRLLAVTTADGQRSTAETFVFGDDATVLSRLCPGLGTAARPPEATLTRFEAVSGALPPLLGDPTGWQAEPDTRAGLLRRDGDTLTLAWPTSPAPEVSSLAGPGLKPALAPAPAAFPSEPGTWPLGLTQRLPEGRPDNLHLVGPMVLPGLGLEGETLSAWLAARRIERRGLTATLWPFGRG